MADGGQAEARRLARGAALSHRCLASARLPRPRTFRALEVQALRANSAADVGCYGPLPQHGPSGTRVRGEHLAARAKATSGARRMAQTTIATRPRKHCHSTGRQVHASAAEHLAARAKATSGHRRMAQTTIATRPRKHCHSTGRQVHASAANTWRPVRRQLQDTVEWHRRLSPPDRESTATARAVRYTRPRRTPGGPCEGNFRTPSNGTDDYRHQTEKALPQHGPSGARVRGEHLAARAKATSGHRRMAQTTIATRPST